MPVCSLHFTQEDYHSTIEGITKKCPRLRKNAVPTKHLPVRSHDVQSSETSRARTEARNQRQKKREHSKLKDCIHNRDQTVSLAMEEARDGLEELDISDALEILHEAANSATENDASSQPALPKLDFNVQCMLATSEFTAQCTLQAPSKDKSVQASPLTEIKTNFKLSDLITTESILSSFTGIGSYSLLDMLVRCVSRIDQNKKSKLSIRDQIILTMCKLKLNLTYTCLAVLFQVARSCCTRYFKKNCCSLEFSFIKCNSMA